jgi:nitrite reductase/ring-hydroxylating ferredoxin subunit
VDDESVCPCTRRTLLGGLVAAACFAPIASLAQPASPAARLRPQPGDRLAFAAGDRAGRAMLASDLALGAAPIAAWPLEAASGLLRDGSRLNQVRVLRLAAAALSPRTAPNAADGVVAYASMCSHAGCDVAGWDPAANHLICPCHGSTFDTCDAAAVAKGPATKPLAMLPLRIENGELRVARSFTRKVGFTPI